MARSTSTFSVEQHFAGKDPQRRKTYERLLEKLRKLGEFRQDPKKTSIHLARKTALAGIAVRNGHLILTVKSDRPLASGRVFKSEQVSAHRFHHELRLEKPAEVDRELEGWLARAWELSG